jgi:dTDP-4-dehydrorhamnose reductase
MRIAVIGANGQLGVDICAALTSAGHEVVGLTHADIEILDANSVASIFAARRPEAIVNTAAMHQVDRCEEDPAKAFAINGIGVRNVAQAAATIGAYLLHVSTDYVFDGSKQAPYIETDAPKPLNVYGNTKLAGEYFTLTSGGEAAVLRVSGIYGASPCRAKGGLNFVRLMLKLAAERPEIRVVDDEILSPTYTVDIAQQAAMLVNARRPGLFHGTAQGSCSWYEFARMIFSLTGTKANLQKARPGEFPAKVRRPSYSVLDNAALAAAGIDIMPVWSDGLARYLKQIGYSMP